MYIFDLNDKGNPTNRVYTIKIYYLKIFENNNMIFYFIPCKNSEGKAGLYDLVENKFYSSETGTDFIAGNEI